jgi:anti-sigma regulatory factor (Ser/Thr protein kinase)
MLSASITERLVYERAVPATRASVTLLKAELGAVLDRAEVEEARRDDISRVMSEAASNVIRYAYPPLTPGLLFVDAALTAGDLLLRVCDCGRGIRSDSPGRGTGLARMGHLCDGLQIGPNRSVPGTRVSAMFRDVGADDAPEDGLPAGPADTGELWEYIATLKATSAALRDDMRTITAYAELALDQAARLRAERGR